MISKQVAIINKLGLHARAAAKFVGCASQFSSTIQVAREGKKVNGKSIMGVMMLAASQGSVLEIDIEGDDETSAMSALEELIANRFGEPQ